MHKDILHKKTRLEIGHTYIFASQNTDLLQKITKRRPSWIFLSAHKSWTKWPILTNLTFLSLSQPAEKNDTKYDLYFTKTKKDEFLVKAGAAILDLVSLGTLEVFATKFFCQISILDIKWHHFRGSPCLQL